MSNSIIIGWIYKESHESVFLAMLAHFGSNCVASFMPVFEEYDGSALPAAFYIGGLSLTAVALLVFDKLMSGTAGPSLRGQSREAS